MTPRPRCWVRFPGVRVVALGLGLAAAGCGSGSVEQPATVAPAARVFVVNNHSTAGQWTVSVIDPASDRVVASIPVSAQPHHIYAIPGRSLAYVTHLAGNVIDILDLLSDRVVGTVRTGDGPRHLTLSRDGTRAYTDDFVGGTVTAVDTASGRTLGVVPVGKQPNYDVVSRDGRLLFVALSGQSDVAVVDTSTLRVLRTVSVGLDPALKPSHPFDVALTRDGSQVMVTGAGDNSLSLISVATLQVSGTIALGGGSGPVFGQDQPQKLNVTVSREGRTAWVGDQANGRVDVVDLATATLAATLPAGLGADIVYQAHAGPAASRGVVTARYASTVTVISVDRPRVVASIGVPGGPHNLAFSPDGTRAFISCRSGNAVVVIDLQQLTVVTAIPVGSFPDGILYVSYSGQHALSTQDMS
jgi:YVTN family beta-propeller protein